MREKNAEDFFKALQKMNEKCGSCKFLEYKDKESFCTKHNVKRSNQEPICDDCVY